jgi:hypothetical protein
VSPASGSSSSKIAQRGSTGTKTSGLVFDDPSCSSNSSLCVHAHRATLSGIRLHTPQNLPTNAPPTTSSDMLHLQVSTTLSWQHDRSVTEPLSLVPDWLHRDTRKLCGVQHSPVHCASLEESLGTRLRSRAYHGVVILDCFAYTRSNAGLSEKIGRGGSAIMSWEISRGILHALRRHV